MAKVIQHVLWVSRDLNPRLPVQVQPKTMEAFPLFFSSNPCNLACVVERFMVQCIIGGSVYALFIHTHTYTLQLWTISSSCTQAASHGTLVLCCRIVKHLLYRLWKIPSLQTVGKCNLNSFGCLAFFPLEAGN